VTSEIRSVAVFCGSRPGHDPACRNAALALGRGLAAAGITLVYGGGRIGLMGAVADGAIEGGGRVIGVIPEFLTRREVAHPNVPDLEVTDSMHSRKQRMFALADAFVALPGGLGTLDELIEIITWRQLGLHDKPILVCDVGAPGREVKAGATGAQAFLRLVDAVIEAGFADPSARRLFELAEGVPALLARLGALGRSPAASVERL
jgi:uncharacterized protein (TIGR00730 family)